VCTRAMWPDANGAVVVGRNMDYERDTETNLWAMQFVSASG
jgi:penicillin V acylase-like amidase (Ntn superfamily)